MDARQAQELFANMSENFSGGQNNFLHFVGVHNVAEFEGTNNFVKLSIRSTELSARRVALLTGNIPTEQAVFPDENGLIAVPGGGKESVTNIPYAPQSGEVLAWLPNNLRNLGFQVDAVVSKGVGGTFYATTTGALKVQSGWNLWDAFKRYLKDNPVILKALAIQTSSTEQLQTGIELYRYTPAKTIPLDTIDLTKGQSNSRKDISLIEDINQVLGAESVMIMTVMPGVEFTLTFYLSESASVAKYLDSNKYIGTKNNPITFGTKPLGLGVKRV